MPWDSDDDDDDEAEMVGGLGRDFADEWHDITGDEIAAGVEEGDSSNVDIDDDDLS